MEESPVQCSGEPLQLHEEPKRLKLTETRDPTGLTPPRPSIMLGELTLTTTDYETIPRATIEAAKPTKVKPFQLHKEPELRMASSSLETCAKRCERCPWTFQPSWQEQVEGLDALPWATRPTISRSVTHIPSQ